MCGAKVASFDQFNRRSRNAKAEDTTFLCVQKGERGALAEDSNSAVQAVAALVRRCWKHSRQKTGRPCVGLKGTVVSLPHPEQLVRVSTLW